MPRHYVVVGGGIAGLSAAYYLRRLAPDAGVTLIEREERLGGKILTEHAGGFTIEAGPESFLSSKPAGIALCRELDIADDLEGTIPENRGTYVMRRGRLYRMPEGLSGLVPAKLGPLLRSGLLSPAGRARAALEPVIPSRRQESDETLGSFVRRRFGGEAYTRLIEALMAGIYAGNGDELSAAATFPQLQKLEQEYGSIVRGMRRAPPRTPSVLPSFLTPIAGMGTMVDALRSALAGTRLMVGQTADCVVEDRRGWGVMLQNGECIPADGIVLATPAYASTGLLREPAPRAADVLAAIPYASTATVSLGYAEGTVIDPLPGYGYIIPRAERRPVLACTWVSSKLAHRAPPGQALLRLFIGRAGEDALVSAPEEELAAIARDEVASTLGITARPVVSRVFRWPRAMPQYTPGHLERLAVLEREVALLPGIALAGSAYRGVGIPDCIASGRAAAERIVGQAFKA